MSDAAVIPADYAVWLTDVKSRIQSARTVAARAVNRELVLLYWDLGRDIVEKQQSKGWGDSVIEQLARDLRGAFPGAQGFSASNLWRMKQCHQVYTGADFLAQAVRELAHDRHAPFLEPLVQELGIPPGKKSLDQLVPEKLAQLVRELAALVPWGHHVNHLIKVENPAERLFYLLATARFGWTRRVLLNQIKAGAYERSLAEGKSHNFPAALPEHLAEQAEETLKSSYNLEFLGIHRAVKERDLEDRLIGQLRDFILELGYGFCFIGRQHRLGLGRKEYFIDLLFYHRFLKCLVALDLKLGEFEPEHAGKMDFYLNLLNEKERGPDDHPSIGIILCAAKDDLEVEFALRTKGNPIGVAEYQLKPTLPRELKGKLPTTKQLGEALGLGVKKKGIRR